VAQRPRFPSSARQDPLRLGIESLEHDGELPASGTVPAIGRFIARSDLQEPRTAPSCWADPLLDALDRHEFVTPDAHISQSLDHLLFQEI